MIFVDMHAEATSEKVAMGWYLDGRVSAVVGSHTHIPTADETILPGGTAYQTDAGMTGPFHSVIGVMKEGGNQPLSDSDARAVRTSLPGCSIECRRDRRRWRNGQGTKYPKDSERSRSNDVRYAYPKNCSAFSRTSRAKAASANSTSTRRSRKSESPCSKPT